MSELMEIDFVMQRRLRDAERGHGGACYELGMACSSGTDNAPLDLIEAHKWFNLAAIWGDERAAAYRVEISEEMTAREIVEAQRRARAWLAQSGRRAA